MLDTYRFDNKIALQFNNYRYVISDIKYVYDDIDMLNKCHKDVFYTASIESLKNNEWMELVKIECRGFGVLVYLKEVLKYIENVDLDTLAKRDYIKLSSKIPCNDYELNAYFDVCMDIIEDCFRFIKHYRYFEAFYNRQSNTTAPKHQVWYELFIGISDDNNVSCGFMIADLKASDFQNLDHFIGLFEDLAQKSN